MTALGPIPSYGEHMTAASFAGAVKTKTFVDSDGIGYWATKDRMSSVPAIPSKVKRRPAWATHVVWFNK